MKLWQQGFLLEGSVLQCTAVGLVLQLGVAKVWNIQLLHRDFNLHDYYQSTQSKK